MIISLVLSVMMLAALAAGLALRRRAPVVGAALALAAAVGLYFVWMPDHLSAVANAMGVGRGTDLLLYLWVSLTMLAFAGIGDPEKFFATLTDAGVDVRVRQAFPDHHLYRRAEAANLIARAEREGLVLVTTEKDLVRLQGQDDLRALAGIARALPVTLAVEEADAFRLFVLERLS